jgi:broad specificity polyphosphatase/5'/3'-nucleotidase SurE
MKPHPVDWTYARAMTARLLPELAAQLETSRSVLNVNFPGVPALGNVQGIAAVGSGWRNVPTRIGKMPPVDGDLIFEIAPLRDNISNADDGDLAQTNKGDITVTPLTLDATDHQSLGQLQVALSGLETDVQESSGIVR